MRAKDTQRTKCVLCETGVNLFVYSIWLLLEKKAAHTYTKLKWMCFPFYFCSTAFSTFIGLTLCCTHLSSFSFSFYFCFLSHSRITSTHCFLITKGKCFSRVFVFVCYISFFRVLFLLLLFYKNIVANGWKEWIRALILAEVCSLTNTFISLAFIHTHELLFFWVNPFYKHSLQALSNYPCIYMCLYVFRYGSSERCSQIISHRLYIIVHLCMIILLFTHIEQNILGICSIYPYDHYVIKFFFLSFLSQSSSFSSSSFFIRAPSPFPSFLQSCPFFSAIRNIIVCSNCMPTELSSVSSCYLHSR